MVKKKLTAEQANELLCEYGNETYKVAQRIVLAENVGNRSVREALRYFIQETWHDLEYPGLMAMTCEAVGGERDKPLPLGASLVLIRGAMDVHDDIIDNQVMKANKLTLLGKYGHDIAILVGDVLFFEGLMRLNEALCTLQEEESQTISNMVKNALFEVGTGVADEVDVRGNFNLPPEDCMKIIVRKSACAEMHARIGAIVGGGDKAVVAALGDFGRLFGVLTIIRDEFIDLYEPDELLNRKQKECLPLPLLFALKDRVVKSKIMPILAKEQLSNKDSDRIVEIVSHSEGTNSLKRHMEEMRKMALAHLNLVKQKGSRQLLASLLDPIYEDI